MTYIRGLLGDMPFDQFDIACYITQETGALATVRNSIPGAPAYTLTAQFEGSNLSFFDTEISVGPFGGTALHMSTVGRGLVGVSGALDAPSTCHISTFFMPTSDSYTFDSGTFRSVFGRTRVASPASYVAGEVALGFAGTANASTTYDTGGLSDFYRRLNVVGNISGTLRTLSVVNSGGGNPYIIFPNQWNQLDWVYDSSLATNNLRAYVNGSFVALSGTFGTTLQGTGAGFWHIGSASGDAEFRGMSGRHSRLRIMSTFRGQDWIQERYRRMIAWV